MQNTIVKFIVSTMAFSYSLAFQAQGFSDIKIENWTFNAANDPITMDAKVPGNIFLDLLNNGKIKNPLLGTTEKDVQWVSQQDWEYNAQFFVSQNHLSLIHSGQPCILHFPCIDTYGDVYVNDQWMGRTDNAFIHWKIPISTAIKAGLNEIKILLHSPYKIAKDKLKSLSYPIPGDSTRAVTRKPQYEYGWDWGPSLAGCGIRQQPFIHFSAPGEIESTWMKLPTEKNKEFTLEADLHHHTVPLIAKIKDGQGQIIKEWSIESATNKIIIPFELNEIPRWCPNGRGEPKLFSIEFEIWSDEEHLVDRKTITTGYRTIELIQEKDQWGKSFYFKINGEKVFMKGANYIPIRFFHEQATEDDYKTLIQKCKAANINMLRVWGGGIYEPDLFYDLCDQNGILIWQDFMFACSMYPGDEGFLNSVQIEAEQQVKRLSHHPCMALWCGNNENSEGWERWGWQMGLSNQSQKSLQKAYDDVFLKLLKNTTDLYSSVAYWPSSPKWGRGDAQSLKEGDCHYWGVWHDAEPFEVLNTKIPRFMSEFGMQSYPSADVLQEMCDTQPCNEKDPGKLVHQKHNRGFQLMHQYMKYWHPTGEGLMSKDYGVLTQYVQAEGITMGIEAQRRHSDQCGGTLFWQLNDVWPAFSWSAMDYRFNKKPLMEQLTYAYGPYLASLENNNGKISLYFINENEKLENANITIQYQEKEAIAKEWTFQHTLESGSKIIWKNNQIKPKVDSRFLIVIHHPQLPNGKYTRTMKGTHLSNQFLVPFINENGWTCQPLFPTEE